MGMSRAAWEKTGGFKFDRFAEDIEFSMRAVKLGLKVGLIAEAFVYHKRRATLKQFFRQVSNFGMGRVQVGRAHPGAIKLAHWFPSFFFIGLCMMPVMLFVIPSFGVFMLSAYTIYLFAVLLHSWITTSSFRVAVLSVPSVVVQMTGYGSGFLKALF